MSFQLSFSRKWLHVNTYQPFKLITPEASGAPANIIGAPLSVVAEAIFSARAIGFPLIVAVELAEPEADTTLVQGLGVFPTIKGQAVMVAFSMSVMVMSGFPLILAMSGAEAVMVSFPPCAHSSWSAMQSGVMVLSS